MEWTLVLLSVAFLVWWVWRGIELNQERTANRGDDAELERFIAANDLLAPRVRRLEHDFVRAFEAGNYVAAEQAATSLLGIIEAHAQDWRNVDELGELLDLTAAGPLAWRGVTRALLSESQIAEDWREDIHVAVSLWNRIEQVGSLDNADALYFRESSELLMRQLSLPSPETDVLSAWLRDLIEKSGLTS